MNELVRVEQDGRPAVRKRYLASDTALFKCLGSGARNEGLVRAGVGDLVPAELAAAATDGYDEVCLEWRHGDGLPADELGPVRARAAGAALAGIHSQGGGWFGSLDGRHRYGSQPDAFALRWTHALSALASADTGLAAATEAWARDRLPRLSRPSPALVHGDFGASNLLWEGTELAAVLDWEYARLGDPREDWAKIAMGARFCDPNSFGREEAVLAALRYGYLEAGGRASALEPVAVYEAYYAAVIGVLREDDGRLRWLAELVAAVTLPPERD